MNLRYLISYFQEYLLVIINYSEIVAEIFPFLTHDYPLTSIKIKYGSAIKIK